ncbi:MAG: hypothetical protein M0D57_02870 [Sphingobacteriales bacterium JAD_PAG50586_3]|nr:MAG: hypothetical protein M0D57_02870 [Sphingobacteriales bacterium JAD_PAG50586_3]
MNQGTKLKYFILAIVFFGTGGIWIPIIIELIKDKKCTFHNVPPNVATYFMSLLFAVCIDYFVLKAKTVKLISTLLDYLLNLLIAFVIGAGLIVGTILLNLAEYDFWALFVSLIGVAISYIVWWKANQENEIFSESTLGGNTEKPLVNG